MIENTEKGKHGGKRTPGKKSAAKKNAEKREKYAARKQVSQPAEMTVTGNECRIPYKSLRIEGKHIVFTI